MRIRRLIFGVGTLAVFFVLAWWAFSSAATWFNSLNPSVSAALTTAILGLLGLWYAQWQSKGRDIAEGHRASKIQVYSVFFDIVEKFQSGKVKDAELHDDKLPDWLRNDFAKLNRGLILWASPEVISSWLEFRRITSAHSGSVNVLLAMDRMYAAIRKDLGNSNFRLKAGDLIRVGLKDPDELKQ